MSKKPKKKLTHATGAPVRDNENILTAGPRGPLLMEDVWYLEKLSHFNREVIPERRMHAKGSGAFGTFTVTHDITKYTNAKLFNKIEFEITESSLMENPIATTKVLQKLKDINIGLSIDDFGTGYSSFAYLTKFAVNKLKIDRSFVTNVEIDPKNKIIIDTAVYLANKLNILTVAEGVETRSQLKIVRDLGVHYGQGFLWTKPLDIEDIVAYLNKATIE